MDDKEMLMKLYDSSLNDEAVHIQYEQKTLSIFTGLILAIMGGVLIVFKDINEENIQIVTLIFGGILIILFCLIATRAFRSNYRRQLETIAFRSKIEHLLDFDSDKFKGKVCWTEESLMMKRYAKDRKEYKDSEHFVNDRLNKGFSLVVKYVFISFGIIGSILIIIGLCKLFGKICNV